VGGEFVGTLGIVNKFFNQELHCFHHKIAFVGYADCIVEWEEVGRELVMESAGDVAGNEAADGCWNANGAELCCIFGVLV
jgi:hypothetical protein